MKKPGMKRPASSSGLCIQKTISKMQRGVSKADLVQNKKETADSTETDTEATGRDKAKGQKYAKMKNSLPEHVLDLVEKQSQKASSPRDYKTMVINKLFTRDSKGKLQLNLDDHLFQEHKRIYQERYAKEQDNAMPESILKGLYFHNDDQAFKLAVKKGEVQAVDCGDGQTMYSFTTYKKGKKHATVEEQIVKSSSKISKQQCRMLAAAFEHVGWSWTYKDKDVTKFLPGATIPPAIQDLIKEATDSQAKLAKEASLIIKAWTGDKSDERFKKLKTGHGVCNTNIAKLNHMKEFHELPDNMESTKENLDQVMLNMATHTSEYNELVEVTRGLIKASKK